MNPDSKPGRLRVGLVKLRYAGLALAVAAAATLNCGGEAVPTQDSSEPVPTTVPIASEEAAISTPVLEMADRYPLN